MILFDNFTCRYVEKSIEEIKEINRRLNDTLNEQGYITINQVLDAEGLPLLGPSLGDSRGVAKRVGDIDFEFQTKYTTDQNGKPIVIIDWEEIETGEEL